MSDKEECLFCCGTGYVEIFDYQEEDWYEIVCEDCGGTGLEDDPEGL